MQDQNKLISERRKKIAEWEKMGFPGYAQKFDRTHTSAQAKNFLKNKREHYNLHRIFFYFLNFSYS